MNEKIAAFQKQDISEVDFDDFDALFLPIAQNIKQLETEHQQMRRNSNQLKNNFDARIDLLLKLCNVAKLKEKDAFAESYQNMSDSKKMQLLARDLGNNTNVNMCQNNWRQQNQERPNIFHDGSDASSSSLGRKRKKEHLYNQRNNIQKTPNRSLQHPQIDLTPKRNAFIFSPSQMQTQSLKRTNAQYFNFDEPMRKRGR